MDELLVKVIGVVVVFNAVVSGLVLFLEKVAPVTKSEADNKVLAVVQKLVKPVQAVLDFISANVKHK